MKVLPGQERVPNLTARDSDEDKRNETEAQRVSPKATSLET